MPEMAPPSLQEEVVEEEPEEEDVSIDILSFSPQAAEPQVQPQSEPQSAPRPSSQPPAPTEENLERQQELGDEELADLENSDNSDTADNQTGDGANSLPYSFDGNCDNFGGSNFDNTNLWPRILSLSNPLEDIPRSDLELFFKPASIDDGTYQAVDNITCLKLIGKNPGLFVPDILEPNAAQANLSIGNVESYGGQDLYPLLQANGTPAALVTLIPIPPGKVLVLTWNIDPRT
ncbi:MAG: hypothetical protein AAFN08_13455 [Cyanobacteria bacterium J06559_3]